MAVNREEERVKSCIRWTLGSQSHLSEQQLKRCWATYGRERKDAHAGEEAVSYARFCELAEGYRNGEWK